MWKDAFVVMSVIFHWIHLYIISVSEDQCLCLLWVFCSSPQFSCFTSGVNIPERRQFHSYQSLVLYLYTWIAVPGRCKTTPAGAWEMVHITWHNREKIHKVPPKMSNNCLNLNAVYRMNLLMIRRFQVKFVGCKGLSKLINPLVSCCGRFADVWNG